MKDDRYDDLAPLLHSINSRCETSFAELYRLTSPLLFGIVLRLVQDRGEAEDVLQDVYVKVWNRCHQFDVMKGRPIAWLAGIARNAALDARRNDIKRPQPAYGHASDEDVYLNIASPDLGAFDLLILKRTSDVLRSCLQELSNEQRESLTLAYYHGLSHAEIAKRLNRPLGTVKSQVRRALGMMRMQLTDRNEMPEN